MQPFDIPANSLLDGCCDHRAMIADEDLHRHAAENIARADALLFGWVTCEMMEAAWRPPAQTGVRLDWMEAFARTIHAPKNYVVSSTLDRVDWKRRARARGSSGECRSLIFRLDQGESPVLALQSVPDQALILMRQLGSNLAALPPSHSRG
jgi:hypothetical protein